MIRNTRHARPRLARGTALAALALAALAACDPAEPAAGQRLSAARFVDVMVELREIELRLPADSAHLFEQRRDEVLARHRVAEADLRAFVARYHRRADVMVTVWDSIAERLRSRPPDPATGTLPPSAGVPLQDALIDELR